MLDKIKNFFKKAPKGFVALPIAVAAVALVTVLALPFFGNNASSDSGNKGPVISFNDKDNNNIENDNDIDNDSNGSGDLVGDNGSSENGDSNNNGSTENNGNSGSTDNNDNENNDQTGNENEGNTGSGSTGGNEGTTSNPSGSTDKDPDDPDDENNSDNNSGSTGDNNGGNSGNTGDNNGGNSGDNSGGNSGNTGDNDSGNTGNNGGSIDGNGSTSLEVPGIDLSEIPAYSGSDYITLNNNTPYFSVNNLSTTAFEFYSELDSLGRCGTAYACLGPELLPDEERGDINSVTPSGWVDSNGLYNRSHLIAFSLAGENDNPKNLITGTSHMNQHTMQIYETLVLDYIKETGNHVIYRVTPMFEGNNLVATGVQMEAWSIEDNGESICFNVFCYNIQEGVTIDYATGQFEIEETEYLYMVNGNNKNGKIHTYECGVKSNLKVGIPCKTLEEAQAKSMEITGKSTPLYAGCCMSGYTSYDNNVVGNICHCSHDHSTVITENIRFYTTIAVRNIFTNTKKNVFMA